MKQRETLLIAISIFITIIAWVGFNVYHASVASTISETLQKQIEPIEGKFDTELIDSLKTRTKILPISEASQGIATQSGKETTVPEEPLIPKSEGSPQGGQQVISAPGGGQ